MATITEHPDSGIGDTEGLETSQATREFIVHLDPSVDATDDVTNPLAAVAAKYPIGTSHPTALNLTVVSYTVGERLHVSGDEARWTVLVRYEWPEYGDLYTKGWQVNWHTALDMELVHRDLDGKWIGGHAYKLPLQPAPPTGLHVAKTIDGDMLLEQRPNDDVIDPRPAQRFRRLTSFSMSALVKNLNIREVEYAENFVGWINSSKFVTGGPGEILVGPMSIRQRPGTTPEITTTGVLYEVTLNFLKREGGWEYERIFDQWQWKGYRGSVLEPNSNQLVFQDFRIYGKAPIQSILAAFAGVIVYTPGSRPGRLPGA